MQNIFNLYLMQISKNNGYQIALTFPATSLNLNPDLATNLINRIIFIKI